MKYRWLAGFVAIFVAACGGGGEENSETNNANGSPNTTVMGDAECQTDDDCPAGSEATFANPQQATCVVSTFRANYCSECANDNQCLPGFACRDATFCEELPPCSAGSECADQPGEVHGACIRGFCDRCEDDADCEDDEVCYSAKCATRTAVDATCLEASCEGLCEIQYDAAGAATGVTCVQ